MRVYIKHQYFQALHYYFFIMAIGSFTQSILFYFEPFYTYIFLGFYIVHSVISWSLALFINRRMEEIYVINSSRYALHHFILTILSTLISIMLWYFYRMDYNTVVTFLFLLNFYIVFMALMWYVLTRFGAVRKLFVWYDKRKARAMKGTVLRTRERIGRELVNEEDIKSYRFGSNAEIDGLLIRINKLKGNDQKEELYLAVRDFELEIWDMSIQEFIRKTEGLRADEFSRKDLVDVYLKLIEGHKKKRMEYEKFFYKKYKR